MLLGGFLDTESALPVSASPHPRRFFGPSKSACGTVDKTIHHHLRRVFMITDVFCKIVAGELSQAGIIYQDDDFIVKEDIQPQAPVHVIIFPKKHVFGIHDATPEMLGKAMALADKIAQQLGIAEKGYRLILNEGEHGGKLVPHLHIHLLGGKSLGSKIVK